MGSAPTSPAKTSDAPTLEEFKRLRKERTSLTADRVYAHLRDSIRNAELAPNVRLVEDDIAAWLQVSRTPVREALLRLQQEGVVERRGGWIVRERTPHEIAELLEARLALESHAAYLAAGRVDEGTLGEMTDLANQMQAPGLSRRDFNILNERFHGLIVDATGNSVLRNLYAQTKFNYWEISTPVVFTPDVDVVVHDQHHTMIAALREGNGDRARTVATNHVRLTMVTVLTAVARGVSDVNIAPPIVLRVPASHLYPGLRLIAENAPGSGQLAPKGAMVLFSDGSTSEARFSEADDGGVHLYVSAYSTLSDTQIPAKRWPIIEVTKMPEGLELHLGKAWAGEIETEVTG